MHNVRFARLILWTLLILFAGSCLKKPAAGAAAPGNANSPADSLSGEGTQLTSELTCNCVELLPVAHRPQFPRVAQHESDAQTSCNFTSSPTGSRPNASLSLSFKRTPASFDIAVAHNEALSLYSDVLDSRTKEEESLKARVALVDGRLGRSVVSVIYDSKSQIVVESVEYLDNGTGVLSEFPAYLAVLPERFEKACR